MLLQIYDGRHWGIENLDRLILFVKDWFIDCHVRFVLNPKNMTAFLASKITMIEDNKLMGKKGLKKKLPFILKLFWCSSFDTIFFLFVDFTMFTWIIFCVDYTITIHVFSKGSN